MKTKPIISEKNDSLLGSAFALSQLTSDFLFRNIDRFANLISARPDEFEQILPEDAIPEYLRQKTPAKLKRRRLRASRMNGYPDTDNPVLDEENRESDENNFLLFSLLLQSEEIEGFEREQAKLGHCVLDSHNRRALKKAAIEGDSDAIEEIAAKAEEIGGKDAVVAAFARENYAVFNEAAAHGHAPSVKKIFELVRENGGDNCAACMLNSGNSRAFRLAAQNGHADVIDALADMARETGGAGMMRTMLASNNYEAHAHARRNGHDRVIESLDRMQVRCEGGICMAPSSRPAFSMAGRPVETVAALAPAFLEAARTFPKTVAMNGLLLRPQVA